MAEIETAAQPGALAVRTLGSGSGGGFSGFGFDPSLMSAIISRKMQREQEDRDFLVQQRQRMLAAQNREDLASGTNPAASPAAARAGMTLPSIGGAVGGRRSAPVAAPREDSGGDGGGGGELRSAGGGPEFDLRNAEIADRIAQLQAKSQPAPTRLVSGPGINPGLTLDPMRMNAYQRQAYLPQNAGIYGDAARGGGGAGGGGRETTQAEQDAADEEARVRTARAKAVRNALAGTSTQPATVKGWSLNG